MWSMGPHGTKCFTSGAVATAGDIVLSYIDEFQFAGSDAGVVGVPNSDSDFGAGYAEGKVLMSSGSTPITTAR